MNSYCNNAVPGNNRIMLPGATPVRNTYLMTVAPQLVARTRFSPPPPKSDRCLSISEALDALEMKKRSTCCEIDTVVIAGPGDPLATPEITLEAVDLIKTRYPEIAVTIHTSGIGSARMAPKLAQVGISHVEIAVEAVRTEVIEKLFAWIRPATKTLKLSDAAHFLIKEQSSGVSALKFNDIGVTIQTTLYPRYNLDHVGMISSEMKELGADGIALVPYSPHMDVEVELESPTIVEIERARKKAAASLPLVEPLIDPSLFYLQAGNSSEHRDLPELSSERPYVAVVSSNGIEVDLHLGHAIRFLIYGRREDGLACLLETRDAPEPGSGKNRWQHVAEILHDCALLLTASAGGSPRRILADQGLRVVVTEENIEGMIDVLYGGGKKKKT